MLIEKFDFPDDLLYTRKHVWVKIKNGEAKVGVTSLGQSLAKGIVHIDLPTIGQNVKRNDVATSFETIKAVVKVPIPLSGKISQVNSILFEKPEIIHKDPYGEGWLFTLYIKNQNEVEKLLAAREASKYFEKFIEKEREKYAE